MKYFVAAFCCFIGFAALAQQTPPTGPTSGRLISSSSGGGSGTVNAGTTPQVAYYASTGTAVSGNAALQFPATEAVFNENGLDYDLRVESDLDANSFIVDGATGNIGMGIAPAVKLHIHKNSNDSNFTFINNINSGTSADATLAVKSDSAAGLWSAYSSTYVGSNGGYSLADSVAWISSISTPPSRFLLGSVTDIPVNVIQNNIDRFSLNLAESVFNETGANYDFRVESDGNANAIFVDASANKVGIATAAPATTFDVNGICSALIYFGPDGSAGSPTYSFSGDPADGMNRDGFGIGAGATLNSGGASVLAVGSSSRAFSVTTANDQIGSGGVTGALWLPPRTVGATADTLTGGTCNLSLAGAEIYLDDTNDSKAAIKCICASNNLEVFEWKIFNFGTLTWGTSVSCTL